MKVRWRIRSRRPGEFAIYEHGAPVLLPWLVFRPGYSMHEAAYGDYAAAVRHVTDAIATDYIKTQQKELMK